MGAMPRRLILLPLLALLAVALPPVVAKDEHVPEITRGELRTLVKRFANDKMKGREAGTPECDRAADLISAEFERLGLKPMGLPEGSWFQPFTSPRGTRVMPTTSLAVFDEGGRSTTFKLTKDFTPVDVSSKGKVSAGVAFAGYGISAPDMAYDDYEGLEVKGRVVVVLRRAPRWQDKRKSPFAPQSVMMRVGTFKAKADAAAAHGAAALIVINDPASTPRSDDELRRPGGSVTGKLPVFHMTWSAGKRLGARIGVPLSRRQRTIDARFTPHSELAEGARIDLFADLVPDERKMKNVVALLEPGGVVTTGAGATASGTIVIGAHYDHVGLGRFGSLSGATGKIHNGADDNASGTTALLEIAGQLVRQR